MCWVFTKFSSYDHKEQGGSFKPKFYMVELSTVEPKNMYEAMVVPAWQKVVNEELKALIRNET